MKFIKRKIIYIPLISFLIIAGLYFKFGRTSIPSFNIVEVKMGPIVQEVSVSGIVKDKESVELGFEKTGRIRKINVDVGSAVMKGTTLMILENGVEASAVDDAKAKLASKQAHYADLKAGGRPEEIDIKESELAKAKADLTADYSAVANILLDAFNKADNAVHRQADILFSNPLSSNPQLNFYSGNQQSVLDAQNARFSIEETLTNFKKIIQDAPLTPADSENSLELAKNYLLAVNDFLIKTNRALNSALNISDSTLATDKDALNTARTNINTSLTNVSDQIQTIATQKITVKTAENELSLAKVGATPEVLAGARADILSAEANVKNAEAVLFKTYIVSPISGTVTKRDGNVGEITPANTSLVAVASGSYKIEAFIPEVDIAKVVLGNKASVTLDAYGIDTVFPAHVIKIDPAETIIEGVSTYKTTLEFDKTDDRIRSGMTANTTILTASRENTLTVPQRAVYDKNGKKFVRVLELGKAEEKEVMPGLRGSSGTVEILSGLTSGELVITSGKVQ